ncbi:UNVERIFIED_CONTAM: hypothetical protein HDU68_007271 [Siphonaria sp. JEL0065]|nr:hypothetical protein HDU68_007271 [Siphonaria sp. JEL0065]
MFVPEQIKSIARKHGLVLVSESENLGTLSFKFPGLHWRVAVYYATQTACVTVTDSVGNHARQLIRDSLSLTDLEDLFQCPKTNGVKGEWTVSCGQDVIANDRMRPSPGVIPSSKKKNRNKEWNPNDPNVIQDLNDSLSQESSIKAHMQDLQERVNGCKQILEKFEQQRKKDEANQIRLASKRLLRAISAEKDRRNVCSEQDDARKWKKSVWKDMVGQYKQGIAFDYSLAFSEGLPRRLNEVRCVAISPEGGHVTVLNSGTYVCRKAPEKLAALLDQHGSGIDYVAMGPQGQFLVQKTNGHIFPTGSSEFVKRISGTLRTVEFVCFGDWETYFVQFRDGSCIWNKLPREVEELVTKKGHTLDYLWLSEQRREYCASFNVGEIFVDGSPTFPAFLAKQAASRRVKKLQFMEASESYFIEYFSTNQ